MTWMISQHSTYMLPTRQLKHVMKTHGTHFPTTWVIFDPYMKYRRGLHSYQDSIQSTQTAVLGSVAVSQGNMKHSIVAPFLTVGSHAIICPESHNSTSNPCQWGHNSRPCSETRTQLTSSVTVPITPQTLTAARSLMSLMEVCIRNSVNSMSAQRTTRTVTNTLKIHVTLHLGYLLMDSLSSARPTNLHGQSSSSTSTSLPTSTYTLSTSYVMALFLHQELLRTWTHSSSPSIMNL